ncbi:MAG: homocysteine S-methyltransferase family protein, partial [Gammaproteobacteria bacterium]|nr:homocysteine S-methyltransferase family protein [Gammaproteobacteria bacterium]
AARPIYRALARTLAPHVDLFVCETMSCAREAVNAAEAAVAEGEGKPVWVSWTLDERPGHGLRSGERIADAVAKLEHLPIDAFLFNCTAPEAITRGLNELAMLTDKPRGAYPNRMYVPSGWTLDNDISTEVRTDLGVDEFVAFAQTWIADGASIVGGCCGVGPELIRALTASLQTA